MKKHRVQNKRMQRVRKRYLSSEIFLFFLFKPEGFKQYSKRYIPDRLTMILVLVHFAFQWCLLQEHLWTTSEPGVVFCRTKLKLG